MINFLRLPKLTKEAVEQRKTAEEKYKQAKERRLWSQGVFTAVKRLNEEIREVNDHNNFRKVLFEPHRDTDTH